jgi:hypothetical protein
MKVRNFHLQARSHQQARLLAVAAAALLAAGCLDATEPFPPLFWSGSLVAAPSAAAHVAGRVEMVANIRDTHAGAIVSGEPELVLSWSVRTGSCHGTGNRLAPPSTFAPIEVSESGEALATAIINYRVGPGSYAAEIFSGPDATGDIIACADLLQS